jgi:hypothetical protein
MPRSTATSETDLSSAPPENRGSDIAADNFGVEPTTSDAAAPENGSARQRAASRASARLTGAMARPTDDSGEPDLVLSFDIDDAR